MRYGVNEDIRWTEKGSDNAWKKWTVWTNKKTELKLRDKTDIRWTKKIEIRIRENKKEEKIYICIRIVKKSIKAIDADAKKIYVELSRATLKNGKNNWIG